MLWLYLLAIVTSLIIVVRRLWLRQKPMSDEVFSKSIALDHVHDGVAWVTAKGRVDYLNPALAKMLGSQLEGRNWFDLFTAEDRRRIEDAYSQMLLSGKAWLDVTLRDAAEPRSLLMVAIHDHKTRFAGHHCILNG